MGDAKQLDTPRAQAAARISVLRDSFCNVNIKKLGILQKGYRWSNTSNNLQRNNVAWKLKENVVHITGP